eukprot:1941329-Lingulodinium_polyedra.AAC.1
MSSRSTPIAADPRAAFPARNSRPGCCAIIVRLPSRPPAHSDGPRLHVSWARRRYYHGSSHAGCPGTPQREEH